jgi:hypothetical protein
MLRPVLHRVSFQPLRVRYHDDDLGCDVLRLIGYRAVCSCGQRSQAKRSKRELRTWKRAHLHHAR